MKFNVNQQDLQQALSYCQGVIEKRSTLPILSNVLLDASNSKLTITATDLDLIFVHQINNIEVLEEGNHVVFAVSKKKISLENLNYWNVKLQEAYYSPIEAKVRYEEIKKKEE